MRRSDEIQFSEAPISAADIAVSSKTERERNITESTIDDLAGTLAMSLFNVLAEEQVSWIPNYLISSDLIFLIFKTLLLYLYACFIFIFAFVLFLKCDFYSV